MTFFPVVISSIGQLTGSDYDCGNNSASSWELVLQLRSDCASHCQAVVTDLAAESTEQRVDSRM